MQEPNGYGAWLLSADDDDGTSKLTTRAMTMTTSATTTTMMTMVMTIIGRARILGQLLRHFEAGVVTGLFSAEARQCVQTASHAGKGDRVNRASDGI